MTSFLLKVFSGCRIQPFPDRQRQHWLRPGPGNGATVKKERRRSSSAKRSWSFGRKRRRRRSRHRRSSLKHVEPDGQSKSGNIRSSEGARKVHSLHRHCCSQVSVRACYRLVETFFGFVTFVQKRVIFLTVVFSWVSNRPYQLLNDSQSLGINVFWRNITTYIVLR